MSSYGDVIRAAIPDADEDVCDFVLWSRTPYPMGRVSARSLYKAAAGWRRACDNKLTLCDHCDNIARQGGYQCEACHAALRRSHA